MAEHIGSCRPWQAGLSCRDFSMARLRRLAEVGVHLIEALPVEAQQLPPDQRSAKLREIAQTVQEAGIGVWSVHIPFGGSWDISIIDEEQRAVALANVRSMLEFCRLLRPRKAIIHPSAEPIADEQRPTRMRASRQSLRPLAAEFAAIGVQLAVENLPRTCMGNTSGDMLELVDGIPEIGICFDTNHLLKETHEQFLSRVAGRVVSMHCSDYDGVDERHWMPGEGIVPWMQVMGTLAKAGYAGPFLFETWKHKDGQAIEPGEYITVLQQLTTA
jgi:sugar phosphate isomerase/epimerase